MSTKISRTIDRTELDNGVRVLSSYYPVRTIGIGFGLDQGSVFDPPGYEGLRHSAEHLLVKGAPGYPFRRAARLLERRGSFDAHTTKFQILVPYVMPAAKRFRKSFGQSFRVLAKLVALPTFNENNFELEKEAIIREIENYDADPAEHAREYLGRTLFGTDHPLAKSTLGNKETIRGLKRETMTAYCQNLFDPKHVVVLSHGHLRHRNLVHAVEAFFRRYEKYLKQNPLPPSPYASDAGYHETVKLLLQKRPQEVILRPEPLRLHQLPEELGGVAIGCRAPALPHPQQFAMEIVKYLLGGELVERHAYMSGDLFYELREKRGLIYHTDEIEYEVSPWSGFFYFCFKTNRVHLERAEEAALNIFRGYRRDGIARSRLEDVRQMVDAHYVILRENEDFQFLSWMLDAEIGGQPGSPDEYVKRIKAVTRRQVMDVVEEFLDPDRTMVRALVYPAPNSEPPAENVKETPQDLKIRPPD